MHGRMKNREKRPIQMGIHLMHILAGLESSMGFCLLGLMAFLAEDNMGLHEGVICLCKV